MIGGGLQAEQVYGEGQGRVETGRSAVGEQDIGQNLIQGVERHAQVRLGAGLGLVAPEQGGQFFAWVRAVFDSEVGEQGQVFAAWDFAKGDSVQADLGRAE